MSASSNASGPVVGFIGLGNMGLPMACTLQSSGFTVVGTDGNPARRAEAARQVPVAEDAAGVIRQAGVVLLSLPSSREVEQVVLGAGGFLETAAPGTLLIDTSSSDPASTRRLGPLLAGRGLAMLDAPVSGGKAGAATGTLTVIAGGDQAAFERARPVLEALSGGRLIHVGPLGAGHAAKAINNLLCAAHLLTTAEAVRLAMAAGLDAGAFITALNAGSGRSGVSEVNYPRWVLPGLFESGFTMGLMRKDVALAARMASECGVALNVLGTAAAQWAESAAALADGEDFNRIVQLVHGQIERDLT